MASIRPETLITTHVIRFFSSHGKSIIIQTSSFKQAAVAQVPTTHLHVHVGRVPWYYYMYVVVVERGRGLATTALAPLLPFCPALHVVVRALVFTARRTVFTARRIEAPWKRLRVSQLLFIRPGDPFQAPFLDALCYVACERKNFVALLQCVGDSHLERLCAVVKGHLTWPKKVDPACVPFLV